MSKHTPPPGMDSPPNVAKAVQPAVGDALGGRGVALILAEIAKLRLELRELRAALEARPREKTSRQARAERRDGLLRELGDATGHCGPWATAGALVLILAGSRAAPVGFERHVERLRADSECPRSQHGIFRRIEGALAELASGCASNSPGRNLQSQSTNLELTDVSGPARNDQGKRAARAR